MIREVDLVPYLPPFLQEYKEQNSTLIAENPEFTIVWDATDRVLKNEFIATADEYGISRFEKILGILPYAEDTLESRRARVQSRWFTSIPYTTKSLLSKLVALCGKNNFTITKRFSVYQILVETNLELFGQVEELERVLQTMTPCNMMVNSTNTIPCTISGTFFVTGGVCYTDEILITNDEHSSKNINGSLNIATAFLDTIMVTVSNDYQENILAVNGEMNVAVGITIAEITSTN